MPHSKTTVHIMGNSPFAQPGDEIDDEPRSLRGADLVDVEDPAFLHICRAAARVAEFGYDPSDPDVAARIIEVGRREYAESLDSSQAAAQEQHPPAPGEVVYYMRIGNRVKIGWSTNLPGRLATINPEELLAVEPGGLAVERQRHRQFAHLRTHGEWFQLTEALTEHIGSLRSA